MPREEIRTGREGEEEGALSEAEGAMVSSRWDKNPIQAERCPKDREASGPLCCSRGIQGGHVGQGGRGRDTQGGSSKGESRPNPGQKGGERARKEWRRTREKEKKKMTDEVRKEGEEK